MQVFSVVERDGPEEDTLAVFSSEELAIDYIKSRTYQAKFVVMAWNVDDTSPLNARAIYYSWEHT